MRIEDITEQNVDAYCVCYDCKRIVLRLSIPYPNNHRCVSGFGLNDSTMIQQCKVCHDKQIQEARSINNRAKLLLMRQYIEEHVKNDAKTLF